MNSNRCGQLLEECGHVEFLRDREEQAEPYRKIMEELSVRRMARG